MRKFVPHRNVRGKKELTTKLTKGHEGRACANICPRGSCCSNEHRRCLAGSISCLARVCWSSRTSIVSHNEISRRGLRVQRQLALPIIYGGEKLDAGYRSSILVVEGAVIVEIKSIDALAPIHDAQVLTYLKLSGLRIGLLMNFNVALLKQGLERFVL